MSFNGSLAFWAQEHSGLLSLEEVALIVRRTAYAVQQLHSQQIIYQDLNPSTILLSLEGRSTEQMTVQLANSAATTRSSSMMLNRSFPANSLLLYMAPEQWIGRSTPSTDQYALAVVAYELLTGSPPFQGPPAQLMDAHINVQPPPPGTVNQRVTPAIDAVMMNALAKRPEDRFPSIYAFAGALEQAIRYPDTMIVNVPKITLDGNLRATLPISSTEAVLGTLRTITLPQGRRVSIAIPKGAQDGQVIRLDGFGDPSPGGGPPGAVLLTIAVSSTEASLPLADSRSTVLETVPTILSPNTSTQQPARRSLAGALNTLATLPPRRRYTLLGGVLAALLVLIIGGTLLVSILQPIGSIPYPPERGVLALNDLLQDNSRGYSWPDASSSNGGCEFSQNSYHVLASQQGASRYCIAGNTGYGNFVYEVQMTLLRGDGGGLIFRANGTNGQFYYFRVGRDGSYALYLYSSTNSNHVQTLVSNVTPAIRTGLNIANTLAIVARDDTFNLYINKQLVTTVKDARYSSGEIGVAADSNPDPTEASFNNAHVWTI